MVAGANEMKTISILIPTYNEEENVEAITEAVQMIFAKDLPEYDYEILFIDNDSKDSTQQKIRAMAEKEPRIKAIFNTKNFGQFNSPYYGILQTTGDCSIMLCADFQDPVDLIPMFVREWEKGYKIVIGRKTASEENRFMYFARSLYYKTLKAFSDVEQIEHFTGFGLYDQSFIQTLRSLTDPIPFLRGIVAELGSQRKEIEYTQPQRRAGKSSYNFYRLYDAAMLGFTSYTKVGLRISTFIGAGIAAISLLAATVYFILKLLYWHHFEWGMAPLLIGMFFLHSVELIFLGILGEYILSINTRTMNRPLVVERERINFSLINKSGAMGTLNNKQTTIMKLI